MIGVFKMRKTGLKEQAWLADNVDPGLSAMMPSNHRGQKMGRVIITVTRTTRARGTPNLR